MKKFHYILVILVFAFFILLPEQAGAKQSWPSGPSGISAEGAIVIDAKSGMVLYEKNKNRKLYPASITKVMTTLVALENSTMSEVVTYSANAVLNLESGASNISLQVGEKLTMEQSLYAVMIQSANEACLGVGEHIAGSVSGFVKMMNARAKSLGCKNTNFVNPNGLWNEKHYTSPYDMALIMQEAMKNDAFRIIAGTKLYNISKTAKSPKRVLLNHHQMVNPNNYPQYGYEYALAGKTGYTSKSEATLVTYAKKGDMELICVVMKTKSAPQGTPNIYTDTIKLFDYCFEKFSQHTIDESTVNEVAKDYLFTKFSPFFSTKQATLSLDGTGSVILPKKVSLEKAEKKVEYYSKPIEQNGKKVIGKLSYVYKGKETGETYILYNETKETSLLVDSLDMNEWVEDAVEKANTPPFPWRTVILIVAGSAVIAAVLSVLFMRIYLSMMRRRTRKNYKRATKSTHTLIWFKKK